MKETIEKKRERIRRQNQKAHERRLKEDIDEQDREVIKMIYDEMTTAEIAKKLGKSKRTIDGRRLYIIQKIGCKNVVGIIKYALRTGIVKPTENRPFYLTPKYEN